MGGQYPREIVRLESKMDCYWNIKSDRRQMKFKYKVAAVHGLKKLKLVQPHR